MAKKPKEPMQTVEVFFKESIEKGQYDRCDALSEALSEIAGLDDWKRFGEFGSGCSASDTFPASQAQEVAAKLRKHDKRRKIAGVTIAKIEVRDC